MILQLSMRNTVSVRPSFRFLIQLTLDLDILQELRIFVIALITRTNFASIKSFRFRNTVKLETQFLRLASNRYVDGRAVWCAESLDW